MNAKLESDKLCPQSSNKDKKLYPQGTDNTHGVCLYDREIGEIYQRIL